MVSLSRKWELEDSDTTDHRTARGLPHEPTSRRGVWTGTSGESRIVREPETPQDVNVEVLGSCTPKMKFCSRR